MSNLLENLELTINYRARFRHGLTAENATYVFGGVDDPEIGWEIIRRCKGYPAQQALIKQLVEACKILVDDNISIVGLREGRALAKVALAAAEKML